MAYGRDLTIIPVQIPNGGSLSAEVAVGGLRIVGIRMPAAWTAAAFTFQALVFQPTGNPPAPVFGEVVDSANAAITVATPAASTYIALADTAAFIGLGRIKVRSGTSGLPVNQAAQRDFFLVCASS